MKSAALAIIIILAVVLIGCSSSGLTEEQVRQIVIEYSQPGPQGEPGETGPRGEHGLTGESGPRGERGLQGEAGPPGMAGERGSQGERGEQGERGPQGEAGPPGMAGERGPQGERGERGERGPQGEQGPPGERGPSGADGLAGPPGPKGDPGEAFMTVSWSVPANDKFSDGVWRIGSDIKPGIYRTIPPEGALGLTNCYWARLSGLSGDFDDIISNENTDSPTQVEIMESDIAFKANGCGEWSRVE